MARKNHDDVPEHPGRILLKRAMEPLGISRNQLARDIDVPVGRISDITNGKRGVTADTALRLGRYFGMAPELWLRLQADYDLHVARSSVWPEIAPRVRVLEAAPEPATPTPTSLAVVPTGGNGAVKSVASASNGAAEPQPAAATGAGPAAELQGNPALESDDLVIPPAPER